MHTGGEPDSHHAERGDDGGLPAKLVLLGRLSDGGEHRGIEVSEPRSRPCRMDDTRRRHGLQHEKLRRRCGAAGQDVNDRGDFIHDAIIYKGIETHYNKENNGHKEFREQNQTRDDNLRSVPCRVHSNQSVEHLDGPFHGGGRPAENLCTGRQCAYTRATHHYGGDSRCGSQEPCGNVPPLSLYMFFIRIDSKRTEYINTIYQ